MIFPCHVWLLPEGRSLLWKVVEQRWRRFSPAESIPRKAAPWELEVLTFSNDYNWKPAGVMSDGTVGLCYPHESVAIYLPQTILWSYLSQLRDNWGHHLVPVKVLTNQKTNSKKRSIFAAPGQCPSSTSETWTSCAQSSDPNETRLDMAGGSQAWAN